MHPSSSNTRSTALRIGLAAFLIVRGVSTALFGEEPPNGNQGQLGVPVTWIEVPDTSDQFYMAQETRDGHLYLTANEAFFPSLGLRFGKGVGSLFCEAPCGPFRKKTPDPFSERPLFRNGHLSMVIGHSSMVTGRHLPPRPMTNDK